MKYLARSIPMCAKERLSIGKDLHTHSKSREPSMTNFLGKCIVCRRRLRRIQYLPPVVKHLWQNRRGKYVRERT